MTATGEYPAHCLAAEIETIALTVTSRACALVAGASGTGKVNLLRALAQRAPGRAGPPFGWAAGRCGYCDQA